MPVSSNAWERSSGGSPMRRSGIERYAVELESDLAPFGLDVLDCLFGVAPGLEAEIDVRGDRPVDAAALFVLAVGADAAEARVAADGKVDGTCALAAAFDEHSAVGESLRDKGVARDPTVRLRVSHLHHPSGRRLRVSHLCHL